MYILLGVPSLLVYNQNAVGEDGNFQLLYAMISRKR